MPYLRWIAEKCLHCVSKIPFYAIYLNILILCLTELLERKVTERKNAGGEASTHKATTPWEYHIAGKASETIVHVRRVHKDITISSVADHEPQISVITRPKLEMSV